MSACLQCIKLSQKIDKLEDDLEALSGNRRLLEIAEEYAQLLADQGKIPTTPAGKRGFVAGRITVTK